MGRADFYKDGDYNAICDQCGYKYKASKLRTQWDGLFTCPKCYDYRNPQDYVRGTLDYQQVPINRPDVPPTFVAGATELPVGVPVANFTVSADSGDAPLTVTFTDTSTGNLLSYTWSFGDGTYSSLQNPVHIYTVAGTYTVGLLVTNDYGQSSFEDNIIVNVPAFLDTFTGSIQDLTSHTANSGQTWSTWNGPTLTLDGSGAVLVDGIAAANKSSYVAALSSTYIMNISYADINSFFEVDLYYQADVDIFNTYYDWYLDNHLLNGTISIYLWNQNEQLVTANITAPASPFEFKIVSTSTTKTIYINGVAEATVLDGSVLSTGIIGLAVINTIANNIKINTLQVTSN